MWCRCEAELGQNLRAVWIRALASPESRLLPLKIGSFRKKLRRLRSGPEKVTSVVPDVPHAQVLLPVPGISRAMRIAAPVAPTPCGQKLGLMSDPAFA